MVTSGPLIFWVMIVMIFLLGMAAFLAGVLLLFLRAVNGEIKTVLAQTAQLTKKGMAEEVVGLVGNARDILEAMNQLVRTVNGIGVLLTLLGLAMMGIASWYAPQLTQVQP